MRLLIDTNVYLELFLKREKHDVVFCLFREALNRKDQTCVSAMSLRDFGYIMHKYLHDTDLTKKLQSQVYEITSKIVSTSADAAISSIYSDTKDFEDSMQMIAAEEAMCDAIITFNKKDYGESRVPTFTPEEMLDIWSRSDKQKTR